MNPLIDDYLKQKFGEDYQTKAQSDYDQRSENINNGSFISSIGDALAGRAPGSQNDSFNAMKKQAKEDTLGKVETAKKDYMTSANFDNEQKVAQHKNESFDPNSAQSKSFQAAIAKSLPGVYTPEQISQMTSADADVALKPAEFKAKLDQAKAQQDMLHEDRQMKNMVLRQSAEDRSGKMQGDAYQKATHDLNSFRGNNAVQQASVALTNAKNALSLADKGNLSPDQLHLFASEMGKLATGGVPGHSEIEALIPDTAKSRLAKFQSFFSNNPTDADAQAFINNNKAYLHELLKNYQGVVDTYRTNTLDGYKKKLSPKDYDELKSRYSSSEKPAGGKITVTNGKETLQIDPSDLVHAKADGYREQ